MNDPSGTGTRHVLIVSMHFPPSAASGAFRILGFVRHLPASGWLASVVTCDNTPGEPIDPALARAIPPDTAVCRIPYPDSATAEVARRVLTATGLFKRQATWCYAARWPCDDFVARIRPDVILTSGPPHSVHLLGRWLSRRHHVPLVTDFRDPWFDESVTGHRPGRVRRWLERTVLRDSAGVIANAPLARAALATAYPEFADKITVIPNGYDPPTDGPSVRPRAPGEPLTLLHAGELYFGRNPGPLLQALANLERAAAPTRWKLRFLGRTDSCGIDVLAEARRLGLQTEVSLDGQVPYDVARAEMQAADVLLLMDGPGRRVGVPAKAYEYIGAGRPILALAEPDGDTAWALEASGARYRLVKPNDVVGIESALVEVAELARPGAANVGGGESPFGRAVLGRQLASFLEGAVLSTRR